eukprot:TRINITY_DN1749_c0_g2_i1.p1 TRINITY_DN1749_c0_g2~~TRINITY_DN1749_c0_g2_i1.p1  ORF type:complete len:186 (-),score=-17.17 TRINITY_DN1749_c0_g2_i1:313-870(-)
MFFLLVFFFFFPYVVSITGKGIPVNQNPDKILLFKGTVINGLYIHSLRFFLVHYLYQIPKRIPNLNILKTILKNNSQRIPKNSQRTAESSKRTQIQKNLYCYKNSSLFVPNFLNNSQRSFFVWDELFVIKNKYSLFQKTRILSKETNFLKVSLTVTFRNIPILLYLQYNCLQISGNSTGKKFLPI